MTSAYENAMNDQQADNYTQQYPVTCEHGNYHHCYFCEHVRVSELEAELSGLRSHHAKIIMALYEIDRETFGPLTSIEGIAELKRQRDEARRQLEQAQATAKSNGEMWVQADTMYKQTINERLEDSNTIRELRERVEELERLNDELSGFDMSFASLALKNQNVGIRHVEYEGEAETPFGQMLDGLGDEVES